MNAEFAIRPRWSTASLADASDTVPMELQHLGAHFSSCKVQRSRWFALRCAVDAVHDFVAPRFVTTLCIGAAVIGAVSLAL